MGPILFTFLRQYKRRFASLKYGAYIILTTGFVAAILLSQLWNKELTLNDGKQSSLPLLMLAFMFALLDCTSSVVFLPYMAKYPPGYMVAFYIGEGMSGVAPSLLALAQGTGGDLCYNVTMPGEEPKGPRFSVSLYFGLLSILLAVSGLAFYLLNTLPASLNERYTAIQPSSDRGSPNPREDEPSPDRGSDQPLEAGPVVKIEMSNLRVYDVFCGAQEEHVNVRWVFIQLYVVTGIICALGNGVIPAILSYACLPYGPTTYHLATELSLLANPIACFAAFFVACKSPKLLDLLCAFAVTIAGVVIYTATLSPDPWLKGTAAGSILIILLCVVWTSCISYLKVCIASILQRYGENALMWCGVVTQLGSCCGAIVIFFINFKTNTFTPC